MDRTTKGCRGGFATGLLLLALAPARMATGQTSSCAIDLGLDYGPPLSTAATARVHVRLGAGAINGGSEATVGAVRFSLQCSSRSSRAVPCSAERGVVAYAGDETITTTCPGVAWSTGHAVGPSPNTVVFKPSTPVSLWASSSCDLEFDVTVLGPSNDATPDVVEQVVSVGFGRGDAACSNGLKAAAAIGGGLGL